MHTSPTCRMPAIMSHGPEYTDHDVHDPLSLPANDSGLLALCQEDLSTLNKAVLLLAWAYRH